MASEVVYQSNPQSPLTYRLSDKIAEGSVTPKDKSMSDQQKVRRKSFTNELVEAAKRRVIRNIETPQRSVPSRLQLQRAAGGVGGQPLITVGRQQPNPFLRNVPLTGNAVRAVSQLRQRNYPIYTRPTGFDRYLRRG